MNWPRVAEISHLIENQKGKKTKHCMTITFAVYTQITRYNKRYELLDWDLTMSRRRRLTFMMQGPFNKRISHRRIFYWLQTALLMPWCHTKHTHKKQGRWNVAAVLICSTAIYVHITLISIVLHVDCCWLKENFNWLVCVVRKRQKIWVHNIQMVWCVLSAPLQRGVLFHCLNLETIHNTHMDKGLPCEN